LPFQVALAIRRAREQSKLSQERLARECGLSVHYVGRIERGDQVPGLETFFALCDALGINADDIRRQVPIQSARTRDPDPPALLRVIERLRARPNRLGVVRAVLQLVDGQDEPDAGDVEELDAGGAPGLGVDVEELDAGGAPGLGVDVEELDAGDEDVDGFTGEAKR